MNSTKVDYRIKNAARSIFFNKLRQLGADISELDDNQRRDLMAEAYEEAEGRYDDYCESESDRKSGK